MQTQELKEFEYRRLWAYCKICGDQRQFIQHCEIEEDAVCPSCPFRTTFKALEEYERKVKEGKEKRKWKQTTAMI